jgi:hypothetical protein
MVENSTSSSNVERRQTLRIDEDEHVERKADGD